MTEPHRAIDVAVIGGGQASLAVGYYLRRTSLAAAILDDQPAPGGAWRHTWPSLRLFSPAQWSSLPGWPMPRDPASAEGYPTRDEALAYLAAYERRYALPVERPVRVRAVHRDGDGFRLDTSDGPRHARALVSATGNWAAPSVPDVPGRADFDGPVIHSATYAGPESFRGRRVVVVGGGNSGAQIVAELSRVADVTWATLAPPHFLPDDVDGRVLFAQATARWRALQEGRAPDPPRSLGDIVMVPPVRDARDRGALVAVPTFTHFTHHGVVWPDGREEHVDAVIFATGFRPALTHLAPLGVIEPDGRVAIARTPSGTRAAGEPMLWLVGYGEWTGFASATLIGVGRSARATVEEIVVALA
ncbi:MAG: NAD(P)/FAD-dependent oxidoreductase [Gemmatimonadetes bacterium]|nr:NAD(P)/FAD-dependent oxidoreductase [Gemmatimonadota bacterium]